MSKFKKLKKKSKTGIEIKLVNKGNYTFIDFGIKVSKIPYDLDKTLIFLKRLEII